MGILKQNLLRTVSFTISSNNAQCWSNHSNI